MNLKERLLFKKYFMNLMDSILLIKDSTLFVDVQKDKCETNLIVGGGDDDVESLKQSRSTGA